jgi:putative ABC transport system permease protein
MTFLSLIFKNIFRHKIRTTLTIFGISIGIATIVVFGLITSGLEEAMTSYLKPGKTDFTVAKAGSADLILSYLNTAQIEKIKKTKGVEEVAPYVMAMAPFGKNPYFFISGIEAKNLEFAGVKIIEGDAYQKNNEIIIGKITKKNKNLKVGESAEINKKNYKIVGVFESGMQYQDSGAFVTLQEAQKIAGISRKVNIVLVKVKKDYNTKEIAKAVEAEDKDFLSIMDLSDIETIDQGTKMSRAISWTISLLAVAIGAIGVMNTIFMSVFERTREIGVLRAIGWRRLRIVKMILGESVMIGILAGIFGTLLGLLVVYLIMQTEIGRSWIVIKYDLIIFIQAFLVAFLVVTFGSIYPAYKAARLLPTEALRYE